MDATRASDGKSVIIKMLDMDHQHGQNELGILQYLRSDQIQANPRNHCIGAFDAFHHPNQPAVAFVVMPVLRQVTDVPFSTVGEVIDFVRQLLEVCMLADSLFLACLTIGFARTGTRIYARTQFGTSVSDFDLDFLSMLTEVFQ